MEDIFALSDELGPAKLIHVHEPTLGLKAVLVVDNVAAEPSIGSEKSHELSALTTFFQYLKETPS